MFTVLGGQLLLDCCTLARTCTIKTGFTASFRTMALAETSFVPAFFILRRAQPKILASDL